jgi:hypothetical protein
MPRRSRKPKTPPPSFDDDVSPELPDGDTFPPYVNGNDLPPLPSSRTKAPGDKGLEFDRGVCRHLPVKNTRQHNKQIVRVRYCRNCGQRKITYERDT